MSVHAENKCNSAQITESNSSRGASNLNSEFGTADSADQVRRKTVSANNIFVPDAILVADNANPLGFGNRWNLRLPVISVFGISLWLTLNSFLLRSLLVRIDEAGAPQFNSEEAHIVRKSPGDATPLDLGHYLPK